MKKLGNKGFSALEGLLVFIVIALLAGVGWYVWDQNQKSETSDSSQTAPTTNQTEPAKKAFAYTLPDDWTEKECNATDAKQSIASPDNDKAVDCSDRENVVLVGHYSKDASDKCLTEAEVADMKSMKGWKDYECEETTINGLKVLETSQDTGGGPMVVRYYFSPDVDEVLNVTYFSDDSGAFPAQADVDMLVKSVKVATE